jgi:hypothetical protein
MRRSSGDDDGGKRMKGDGRESPDRWRWRARRQLHDVQHWIKMMRCKCHPSFALCAESTGRVPHM